MKNYYEKLLWKIMKSSSASDSTSTKNYTPRPRPRPRSEQPFLGLPRLRRNLILPLLGLGLGQKSSLGRSLQLSPHQEPKKDTNTGCNLTRSTNSTDMSMNIDHYADISITNCFTCMEYQWSLLTVSSVLWMPVEGLFELMSRLWSWVWISQPYEQLICLLQFLLILNYYSSIFFYFGCLWRN
jgi:hypothetical protein